MTAILHDREAHKPTITVNKSDDCLLFYVLATSKIISGLVACLSFVVLSPSNISNQIRTGTDLCQYTLMAIL